jgi:hypothetical protein
MPVVYRRLVDTRERGDNTQCLLDIAYTRFSDNPGGGMVRSASWTDPDQRYGLSQRFFCWD